MSSRVQGPAWGTLGSRLTPSVWPSSGDQVLEWNGRVLQGATFNEVYNIILESKAEAQVELVVSRQTRWVPASQPGSASGSG